MKYIVETPKSVEQAVADFEAAVQGHKFGVLHIPQPARNADEERRGLSQCVSLEMNMALPCRGSVYAKGGKTKVGRMKPSAMLKSLSDSPALAPVVQEVEEAIIEMIGEAK